MAALRAALMAGAAPATALAAAASTSGSTMASGQASSRRSGEASSRGSGQGSTAGSGRAASRRSDPAVEAAGAGVAGPLTGIVRAAAVGMPLAQALSRPLGTPLDPATAASVRALALAEHTGAPALPVLDRVREAQRGEEDLARLLDIRTVQARGTARVLAGLPLAGWLLLAVLDPGSLAFFTRPAGWVCAGLAALCGLLARWWTRRILARAAGAGLDPSSMAEVLDLYAAALDSGLEPGGAAAAVADLAAPPFGPALRAAARRLAQGWDVEQAFAAGPLAELGGVLAPSVRWGTPAAPGVRELAAHLRAGRRAAAEAAAERAQLLLVFPTTLLTVPSFVLATVPPLLWSAFANATRPS